MVKLQVTNIVGTASNSVWSQVRTITLSPTHQVMMVIKLSCDDPDSLIDLPTTGVGIIDEIGQKGAEEAQKIVEGIADGLTIDLLVATLHDSTFSIYKHGEVEVYLSRAGRLAKLENGESGELVEGDKAILATLDFGRIVTLAKLGNILRDEDEPAELLTPIVHTQSETSGVGAMVVKVVEEMALHREIKIKLRNENPRKNNLWIGGVIFLLLVVMIGVGMVRRVKLVREREFVSLETSVSAKIAETLSSSELNPEKAKTLLSEAKGEVNAYLAGDITDSYKQKGNELIKEIEVADEQVFKKNDTKLTTVVELSILNDGLAASKMKSDGKENLIFNDQANPKVVLMNLVDRSKQIIDTAKNDSFVDLGVSETKVYGLNNNGVMELFWKNTDPKKVIESDEFWVDPMLMGLFANNVYVLDKGQGEIWKYPALETGFGGRRRWFAPGIAPDLANVVDMKVVGDIWLLTSTGKLERYSRGAPVAFALEGFPATGEAKKFSEPRALWVSESAVYVLESGASRIVVFGKDGKYQSQYVNEEFGKASDLVVIDNKGYVLIDNTVKEFGL